ncbi:hypothetical protein PanWU01x14_268320 [Parasponia andersonii]|uniref:25S rRNA (uridine-N(3))-methyltransferase BMT5-like domain-containing protein n=1 Tax=Parasponia andersonii TaxID=3476 RepID=A0A2P5B604_PARAD|nr:hypothetical protein PanWU01x14_268320 [Parasponia andersonii]
MQLRINNEKEKREKDRTLPEFSADTAGWRGGDFSFAACLAKAFGSAENMVATSLDSEDKLLTKHWSCVPHLEELKKRGNVMNQHHTLKDMKFDVIVFNFPHAGHVSGLCERDTLLIE